MKTKNISKIIFAVLAIAGTSLFLTACKDNDLEDAADSVGDAMHDGANAAKEAVHDGADAVKDATN